MPTWLITGTPASAIARMIGAFSFPPCILTTSAPPSFIRRSAFTTPMSGVAYEPYGIDTMIMQVGAPRRTACACWIIMSTVTGSVFGKP